MYSSCTTKFFIAQTVQSVSDILQILLVLRDLQFQMSSVLRAISMTAAQYFESGHVLNAVQPTSYCLFVLLRIYNSLYTRRTTTRIPMLPRWSKFALPLHIND